mgnify:CR=1 FL=1
MNALDALGNATRRRLLELIRDEPRPVNALYDALRATTVERSQLEDAAQGPDHATISRPAVSRHLRVLKAAALVTMTREGTRNDYRVCPSSFADLRAYLDTFWDDALPRYALVAENLGAALGDDGALEPGEPTS